MARAGATGAMALGGSIAVRGGQFGAQPRPGWRQGVAQVALRLAPFIVLGPITGLCFERAIRAYRRGETTLAAAYLVLSGLLIFDIIAFGAKVVDRGLG